MRIYNDRKFFLKAVMLSILLAMPAMVKANTTATICFYSPNANINNFASLKRGFDTYLSSQGSFRFQPFSNAPNLDQFAVNQGCQLFMLSNEYFQKSKTRLDLKKKMSGVLNGRMVNQKVFSTKSDLNNIKKLQGKSIASSSNEEKTRKMLLVILGDEYKDVIRSVRILEVPKDIDALMAINYGVAFAAITTNTSLELLATINPKLAQKLKRVGGMLEIPFPVIAISKNSNSVQALLDVIRGMDKSISGKEKLQLLGLDSFRELSNSSATGGSK